MPETDHLKTPGRSNWNRFLGPTATATMRNRTPNPSDPFSTRTKLESCCVSRHQPTPTPPWSWPQAPHRRNQTPACPVALAPSFQVLTDSASARYQRRIQRLRRCLFRSFLEHCIPPPRTTAHPRPHHIPKHHITSPLSLERPRFAPFLPSNPRSSSRSVRTWSPFALGPLGCVSGCPMRTSGGSSLSVSV